MANIFGTIGNDSITGTDQIDFIFGQAGDDTMDGGGGPDAVAYFDFGRTRGVVVNLGVAGPQVIDPVSGETDTLVNFEWLWGSEFGDTLTGDGGVNLMAGLGGNDVIDGGGGFDVAHYGNAAAAVRVALDTTGWQNTLGAGTDRLANMEMLIGSQFNDTLIGSGAAELFDGQLGDDRIDGGGGGDTVRYEAYQAATQGVRVNLAITGQPQDTFSQGFDTLLDIANLVGSIHADTLAGNGDGNLLSGWSGDDVIRAGAGADTVYGDKRPGDDVTFLGVDGRDTIDGGEGGDTLYGQGGADQIQGGEGGDRLTGDAGDDWLHGNAGADTVQGGEGDDWLYGGAHNDQLDGGDGRDSLVGDLGDDSLAGGSGDDWLHGRVGADTVAGGDGADRLYGGQHGDWLDGGADRDDLWGDLGNDTLAAGDGQDFLSGGSGDDLLMGGAGDDVFRADAGADTLEGGSGQDELLGSTGDDWIDGGDGDDFVSGDWGQDTLAGGRGADIFSFRGDWGDDRVVDFNAAEGDRIHFSGVSGWQIFQAGNDLVLSVYVDGEFFSRFVLVGVQSSSLPDDWLVYV